MSIIKKLNMRKIISIIMAVFMILPILPALPASAAVSGIQYYDGDFELPLYGATGCLVKDVSGIKAGTAFTILEENGNNLKVKLSITSPIKCIRDFYV